jgi:hypothetical protein
MTTPNEVTDMTGTEPVHTTVSEPRCSWKIRYGTSAETITQCDRQEHHDTSHEGPGLPQFPGQRIIWWAGDRREYSGDWPGYCTRLPGEPFEGGCVLPAGHRGRCAP